MSGELKVKKELDLEREKAKQKEKELDSSVRALKTREEEVKKLNKVSEQQEKVLCYTSCLLTLFDAVLIR